MIRDFQMIYEIKVIFDVGHSNILYYHDDKTLNKITRRSLNKLIKKIKYFLKDFTSKKIEENYSDEFCQFDVLLKLDKHYEKKIKMIEDKINQILWEHPLSVSSYHVKIDYKIKSISNI